VSDQRTSAADPAALGTGTGWTLLAALGFAAVSTLTSLATGERVSLFTVLTWRYTLGAVVMVTWVSTRGYPKMPWKEALRFIVLGGGGQALLVGLALSSLQHITAATLGFLFYTYPAWVTLVQALRGAEPLSVRRVVALALSFGGIVVIVFQLANGGSLELAQFAGSGKARGIALALGAAAVYGLYIPLMQWMQKSHPIAATSAYAKIGSALCFLMLAVGQQSFSVTMSVRAWGAIIALTLFSTVLPSVFFLKGLMRLGPVRTAIVSTVEPFLTALLGALVLAQPITLSVMLGGAMIVAAVVLLQYRRERVA
jgi:drug/metabolite transporter (DMT)-like permease